MGKVSKAAGGGSKKKQQQQQQQQQTSEAIEVVVVAETGAPKKRGRTRSTAAASPTSATDTTKMFSKKKKTATAVASTGSTTDKSSNELNSISSTETAIMEMFKEIAEDPSDPNSQADLDGISILGEKLEIDAAEDIRILVLLWKLGVGKAPTPTAPDVPTPSNRGSYISSSSSSYSRSNSYPSTTPTSSASSGGGGVSKNFIPGTIQCSEWKYGCSKLNIDSWEKLLVIKPSLDIGFLDTNEFREFYKFCFRFNLNGTHKSLENDTAIGLLQMIYTTNNDGITNYSGRIDIQRYETIIQFLQDPETLKVYSMITLDQWMGLYDFCSEIPTNDMLLQSKIYDESTSAWPVLIDDYVEYIQSIVTK